MVDDFSLWKHGETWSFPICAPVINPETELRWTTYGSLCLIHLLTLGAGPDPVSPFLIYLLLISATKRGVGLVDARDMNISLQSIRDLDQASADILKVWMHLKHTDNLHSMEYTPPSPLSTFLARFEYQVISFVSSSLM